MALLRPGGCRLRLVLPFMLQITQRSFNCERLEELTLIAPSQSESCYSSDNAEDIMRKRSDDFTLGWIGTMKSKSRPRSGHNLLLFGASELSKNSLSHCSGGLQSQAIHEHIRSGRHRVLGRDKHARLQDQNLEMVKLCGYCE